MILFSLLVSCKQSFTPIPSHTWTVEPSKTPPFVASPTYDPTPTYTATPIPSSIPTATFTPKPSPTMAALDMFISDDLRQGVLPMPYIENQCEYLQMRWSLGGSLPGTVVVPIMFHSIVKNGTLIADPNKDISVDQFTSFVNYARYLGFKTITTHQLLDFLLYNTYIPQKSMMIIVDDRKPGTIQEWIMPVLEESDWSVTSAYIADPNSLPWAWDLMDLLFTSGRMDVQSHGYTGQLYIVEDTTLEQIQNEIWNSTQVLQDHFGARPIAFIWPGGNFTAESVQVAHEGGYQLGFTAYSRGPILFNWIPLGEKERGLNDPLMLLPRAWSSAVNVNLDKAIKIGEQAAEFAQKNYGAEATWYQTYCGGELTSNH